MTPAAPQQTLSFPRQTFAKLSPHPYLLAHLQPASATSPSTRANGRECNKFRPSHINNGSLTHAEGSAVVRIGDTAVVCGIRAETLLASDVPNYRSDRTSTAPSSKTGYNEPRDLDLLVPNIELATGCSPAFLPGQPPSTLAQSLSTRIYSLLHSSALVDGEDLRIWYQPPDLEAQNDDAMDEDDDSREAPEPEVKAFWTLYIDILFISLDGNPFDAAWAAVLSALGNLRLPQAHWDPDREMILCEDTLSSSKKLNLRGFPIAVTLLIFNEKEQARGGDGKFWMLVDPDSFEEGLCDESVTVVVDCSNGKKGNTKILSISKSGGTMVDKDKMKKIVKLAESRWDELSRVLKS